jgi:hypothetical protein
VTTATRSYTCVDTHTRTHTNRQPQRLCQVSFVSKVTLYPPSTTESAIEAGSSDTSATGSSTRGQLQDSLRGAMPHQWQRQSSAAILERMDTRQSPASYRSSCGVVGRCWCVRHADSPAGHAARTALTRPTPVSQSASQSFHPSQAKNTHATVEGSAGQCWRRQQRCCCCSLD